MTVKIVFLNAFTRVLIYFCFFLKSSNFFHICIMIIEEEKIIKNIRNPLNKKNKSNQSKAGYLEILETFLSMKEIMTNQ